MRAGEDITSFEISDGKTVVTTTGKRVPYPKGQYYKISESYLLGKGWSQKGTSDLTLKWNVEEKRKIFVSFHNFHFLFLFQQIWQNPHLPALLSWGWDMWYHSGTFTKFYCIFDLPFSPRHVWQGNLDDMLRAWWELLPSFFSWLGKVRDFWRTKTLAISACHNIFSWEQSNGPGVSRKRITQVHPG